MELTPCIHITCEKNTHQTYTQWNLHRVYTLHVKKHTPDIEHIYTVQLTSCIHNAFQKNAQHTPYKFRTNPQSFDINSQDWVFNIC